MKIPTRPQVLGSKKTDANERLSSARLYLGPRRDTKKDQGYESHQEGGETLQYLVAYMDRPSLNHPSSDGYSLHRTEHSAVLSTNLGYVLFFQVGIIVPDSSNKFIITYFF